MKINTLIIVPLCLLIGFNNLKAQNNQKANEAFLEERMLDNNEAVIWYLGHCGYAVKTKTKLLIFDYQEKRKMPDRSTVNPPVNPSLFNGWINPEEIKDLDIVVFVSHSHSDHYDEIIFSWENKVRKIDYVFGWQEKEGKNYHLLPAPRNETKFDEMEIYTVNSHHSGVPESAFLIKVDGLTIYHNGDYIGKMGENASSNITDDMNYLKTKFENIDLLFIGASTDTRLMEIVKSLKPRLLMPMHYGYQEVKYNEYASEIRSKVENLTLFVPAKKGDNYEYKKKNIADH